MGLFDFINDAAGNVLGDAGEQINNVVEDATGQIPGADQVQDVADQTQQAKEDVLPGDESSEQ